MSRLKEQCDQRRSRIGGWRKEKGLIEKGQGVLSGEIVCSVRNGSHGDREHRGNLLLDISALELQGFHIH